MTSPEPHTHQNKHRRPKKQKASPNLTSPPKLTPMLSPSQLSTITLDPELQKQTRLRLSKLNTTINARLQSVLSLRTDTQTLTNTAKSLADELRGALISASAAAPRLTGSLVVLSSASGTMGDALTLLANLPPSTAEPLTSSERDVEGWSLR